MRKIGIIFFIVVLFLMAVLMGIYIYKINQLENNGTINSIIAFNEKVEDESAEFAKLYGLADRENTTEANATEEKVSPNCALVIKKQYNQCGHTINEYLEVPSEIINFNKQKVEKYYKDWEVKSFTSSEIVLYKEILGTCNEHYLLKEKDGFIAIYLINENDEEILKEVTKISTEYLTRDRYD